MDIFHEILTKNKAAIENAVESCNVKQECENFFKDVDLFLETGNINYFKSLNYGKENVEPIPTSKRRGRTKKPLSANTDTESNLEVVSINIKKEKLSDIREVSQAHDDVIVHIKSEVTDMPAPTKLPPRKKKIKTEQTDVPVRSTRTRTRKLEANETISSGSESIRSSKVSDVIIENVFIPTIEISDNGRVTDLDIEKTKNLGSMRTTRSKMKNQNKELLAENCVEEHQIKQTNDGTYQNTRSTRTKTKQKKRARSNSMEPPSTEVEKLQLSSDLNKEGECNGTVHTEYEDALSVVDNGNDKIHPANATYIASKDSHGDNKNAGASTLNSTVIIENPKIISKELQQIQDQKRCCIKEGPATPPPCSKKAKKQIFSPFEKTPLKKKIEAFERLGEACAIPIKVTGTKKKSQRELKEDGREIKTVNEKSKKSYEVDKFHKVATPGTNKFFPKGCSTSKINKLHPVYGNDTSTSNESILSAKSASALKASQAEFREREKKRQEKEREALKKREALLHAQTEEKRRKREEKQQKAQQQREILEKEKQKLLETQKIKEEKFKQVMVDREEKLQKQKEEAEKKRLGAKKKANELLKEREELMRIAEQKKCAEMKQGELSKMALKQKLETAQHSSIPIYMTTKPPLLPTNDCYDSDDPEYEMRRKTVPSWCTDRELRIKQVVMISAGETIKNTFFCRQAQTPDLQDIFELIDPRKLKRTSSAIWRKPPRYTLMPTLEDTIEYSEDSD